MPTNFKLYLIIAASALVILAGYLVYNLYIDYQLLKLEKDILQQNVLALRDSTSQMADSLIKTSVFVRDLNNKLQKKNNEYIALEARFAAWISAVHDSGASMPVVTSDSIKVPFSGEKNIVKYSGYTVYNFNTTTSWWSIDIIFNKPVEIGTELVEENGIWKFRAWSLTAGVDIKGGGVLDIDTYRRLQKYAPVDPPKRFMVGAIIGQHGGIGAGYNFDSWTILGYYTLLNKYDDIYKNINIGVFWRPF